ncbi:MAG: hypothetical protein PHR61_01900 [Candidatus Absconditabacteria bacterium]|nr:hypothetical protein [Candidatus Absconditabacteria bacterium]
MVNLKQDKNTEHAYHKYYRERSVKNGVPFSKLMKDCLNKTYYPIKSGKYDIAQKSIFEVLNSYTHIVPFDREKYESVMASILTVPEDKSCLILFNHDNFATMTAFIREMYQSAKRLKQNNPERDIDLKKIVHTIVGPAITTQKQIRSINGISNVLKTVPARDNIPEINPKLDGIRLKFIKHFLELSNVGGQIFLMAPTGTRDIINRNNDGTLKSIMFQDDESIPQTTKIIKLFAEKGNKIVLVGTNGAGLKRPGVKRVKERDNNRTTADVYIDSKELTSKECISLIEEKKLMETIASLVRDNQGNSIGQTIDSDLFDMYKCSDQEINIEQNNYQNHHFQDSIRKKIVRKLYELFK